MAEGLCESIAAVASLGTDGIVWQGSYPRLPRSGHGQDTARILPGVGIHSHPTLEIAIAVRGRATITFDGGICAFAAPRIAVLHPGVRHAEGYWLRDEPYTMLWVHYCSRSSVFLVVSRYSPGQGWDCTERFTLSHRAAAELQAKASDPSNFAGPGREMIRANLLSMLVELNGREASDKARRMSASPARAAPLEVLQRVQEFLDSNYDKPIDVGSVAAFTRFSPNYLGTLFSEWKGLGIHEYITARRMERAMELLRESDLLVKQIAERLGYSDPLYFSRAFKRFHGHWPTQVRPATRRSA